MTTTSHLPSSQPAAAPAGRLPVAVVGAGPIGLVAAAHLVAKGERPVVFEAGQTVGANIREWAHVRLFSPWKYLIDPVARQLLEAIGWEAPSPDRLPTGRELVDEFLEPLAALPAIAPHLHFGHQVLAVTRRGLDKVRTAGRDTTPFELIVRGPDGRSHRILARAVIDASGTWRAPNPLGAGGVPAAGEAEHASQIHYGIPDVLGRDRARYAGRRTLVVGSGHSAFNALLDLAALAEQAPGTEVVWAIRRTEIGLLFGGGRKDALEARGALGSRLQRLVTTGRVEFLTGVRVEAIHRLDGGRLTIEAAGGRRIEQVDEIIVTTGFRPDLTLTRELRLKLDPWLEAPEQLAPLIDPNLHSCGTVYPHGFAELAHPERDFYVVGMKSYGRAPTFLLLTGYEQVRSVVSALVGDEAGARNVELVLPETGVCQTDLGASACCGTTDEAQEPALVGLTVGASAIATEAVAAARSAGTPERAPTAGGCGCGTAPAPAGKTVTACCR
jgi:cation diffusion facilitator CzcD-associated flavoprotein CzcO